MQGIQKIAQEVNKKSKLNSEETTKKVITAFLEVFQQKIIQGSPEFNPQLVEKTDVELDDWVILEKE